jgi:hypothetical protein
LPERTRTWYGAPARVRVGPGGLSDAALWDLALPHPSLVNMVIRHGLAQSDRFHLSYWHELGHLQAIPLVTAAALTRLLVGGARSLRTVLELNALWELLAGGYVVAKTRGGYFRAYGRVGYVPLAIFWIASAVLSVRLLRELCQGTGSRRSGTPLT